MRAGEIESKAKKEKQDAHKLQMDYQNVFTSGPGSRVLRHHLLKLKYWAHIDTDEDRIRHNVAQELVMTICGERAINLPDVIIAGILSAATTDTGGDK